MNTHNTDYDAPGIPDDWRPPSDREALGEMVRRVWIEWAKEQEAPKPSWLVPWENLSEPDREVDRRIGEALYRSGYINGLAARECGARPNLMASLACKRLASECDGEHVDGPYSWGHARVFSSAKGDA